MQPFIEDSKLREKVESFFAKLEKFYPEHKVFSLDSIDKELREKLSMYYKLLNYNTADEFLDAYGYQMISGDAVRQLRNKVIYTPGNEPEPIKGKVESMLRRLEEYYPDRKIQKGLQSEHKKLSQAVSGLYQWLGYANSKELLNAYGYSYEIDSINGGRPSNNHQEVINILLDRYKDKEKHTGMKELLEENQDIAGQIKTLQNKSNELFGKPLSDYFNEIGLINKPVKEPKVEKLKTYHYVSVTVEGQDKELYCATDTRTLRNDDYIEMCLINNPKKLLGKIKETYYFTLADNLPMDLDEMYQFIRKISKAEVKDMEMSKVQYIYCKIKLKETSTELSYISPFDNIKVNDIVEVPYGYFDNVLIGTVTEVLHVSEKTAPYPVKRTKKIISILQSKEDIVKETELSINNLISSYKTEIFVKENISKEIEDRYLRTIYYASAVFRGWNTDVYEALKVIYPKEINPFAKATDLGHGISQFECPSNLVEQIISSFPNLKGLFFAEYWKENAVYLAYSESGYNTVTSLRYIDKCNFFDRDRWPLVHDPSEESFSSVNYSFEEKNKWEALDYCLNNNDSKLVTDIKIVSKPYKKNLTTDPCEILKLRTIVK